LQRLGLQLGDPQLGKFLIGEPFLALFDKATFVDVLMAVDEFGEAHHRAHGLVLRHRGEIAESPYVDLPVSALAGAIRLG
jgi:hypothetical protein